MNVDENQIAVLLRQPLEGLQVELKTWLDPRADADKAKLVKAIFAIRNRNGGYLIIGFDDATRASYCQIWCTEGWSCDGPAVLDDLDTVVELDPLDHFAELPEAA